MGIPAIGTVLTQETKYTAETNPIAAEQNVDHPDHTSLFRVVDGNNDYHDWTIVQNNQEFYMNLHHIMSTAMGREAVRNFNSYRSDRYIHKKLYDAVKVSQQSPIFAEEMRIFTQRLKVGRATIGAGCLRNINLDAKFEYNQKWGDSRGHINREANTLMHKVHCTNWLFRRLFREKVVDRVGEMLDYFAAGG